MDFSQRPRQKIKKYLGLDGLVYDEAPEDGKTNSHCGYTEDDNGVIYHYIMFDLADSPFNPFEKVDIENNLRTARMRGNVSPYRFSRVNKQMFSNYQEFLRTRNRHFLSGVKTGC